MIRILITGANGQLGQCLRDKAQNASDLELIYTDYEELDITNSEEVDDFFSKNSFDYCINCAAYTLVDKAESEEAMATKINIDGARNLASACEKNGVVILHISTDFVFSGEKSLPYGEEDTPDPLGIYGATKLEGEREIARLCRAHIIVRTSWLYSEYGNNFLITMLKLGESKTELRIVADQIGTPTYAGDLATILLTMIRSSFNNFGLYHYSNEGVASWYDFAQAIFDFSEISCRVQPIKSEEYPTAAKRPGFSVLDKTKIKNNLSIEIPYWRDSLREAIRKLAVEKG